MSEPLLQCYVLHEHGYINDVAEFPAVNYIRSIPSHLESDDSRATQTTVLPIHFGIAPNLGLGFVNTGALNTLRLSTEGAELYLNSTSSAIWATAKRDSVEFQYSAHDSPQLCKAGNPGAALSGEP